MTSAIAVPAASAHAVARVAALSATQAAAVNSAEGAAASLPVPQSKQQIIDQAAAVQPSVDNVMAAATASGNANVVQTLLTQSSDLPGGPAVRLAVLNDSPVYNTSSAPSTIAPPGPVLSPSASAASAHLRTSRAHAAGCWGANNSVSNKNTWGWPFTVADEEITSKGWCGNGSSITWFNGFSTAHHLDFPGYCWYNTNSDDGSWIKFWSWVHGGMWNTLGVGTSYGCIPDKSHAVTIREAANGYWDKSY
jgi:hypothetical protein